jgi:hypothetical protein
MTKTVSIQAQQKWEYCIETSRTENSLLVKLNGPGQQRWELVEILYYKDMKAAITWAAFPNRPNIGQSSKPGEESEIEAKTISTGQTEGLPAPMKGIDLQGSDFQIKTVRSGFLGTESRIYC